MDLHLNRTKVSFLLFLFIFINTGITKGQKDWTVVASYEIPGKASGLAYDGTYLYFGIYGVDGDHIYRFNPTNGNHELLFITTVIEDAYGLSFDGEYLWTTDHPGSSSDPAIAFQLDFEGNMVSQFDLPDHYMSGIACDGNNFWVCTYYPDPGTIYQLDNSGSIISQFTAPGTQPWDICTQNEYLWVVNEFEPYLIYQIDQDGNIIESYNTANTKPAGIVFDGNYIWYVDGPNGSNSTLYKVSLGGSGTPIIDIPVSTYDYGLVTIGEESNWECMIHNEGDGVLEITQIIIQNAVPIFNEDILPMEILPQQSNFITLTYQPQEPLELNTIVTVVSNDPVTPEIELELLGQGVYNGPYIEIPLGNHDYGTIRNMATSKWEMIISNLGDETLTIESIESSDGHFYVENQVSFPLTIESNGSETAGIWFYPDAPGDYSGIVSIHSNDPSNPTVEIAVEGSAVDEEVPIGDIFWTLNINVGWDNSIKAIGNADDINGDNIPDVIICTEDDFIRCINANADGLGDIIWEYEAGSVYSQNGLAVISDVNDDGIRDIAVGLAWGARSVKVLSGMNGTLIWSFETQIYGDGGWVYCIDSQFDYNSDGLEDILASSGDDSYGTGPKRIFCLDAVSGDMIWDCFTNGPNFSVAGTTDFTGDDIPDVIGGASNDSETEGKIFGINGANGNIEWDLTTNGTAVWDVAMADDISGDNIHEVIGGDSQGSILLINPLNGSILQNGSVGNSIILRFEKMDDINSDGIADFAIASSSSNALIVDGTNAEAIWLEPLNDKCWNIDRIADVNGDGLNDLIAGTLFSDNYYYFLDGNTGDPIYQAGFTEPIDAIGAIHDINGDGSMEMVIGGREGNIRCVSGGLDAASLLANFMGEPTQGYVPLTVNFTDLSQGEDINAWEWDFQNDGIIDAYDQNPQFVYETEGMYDVKLTVSNAQSSNSIVKTNYIDVLIENIPKNIIESDLKVYPNPFSDFFIISWENTVPENFNIELYDLSGKLIKQFDQKDLKENQLRWNHSTELRPGSYLLIYRVQQEIYTYKINYFRN